MGGGPKSHIVDDDVKVEGLERLNKTSVGVEIGWFWVCPLFKTLCIKVESAVYCFRNVRRGKGGGRKLI